jgi:DNA-binding PadR family transcriptional regulator
MPKRRVKRVDLTTPDLVILSLLDERPRHGYDVNAELERRQVRDWAGVSRPQVYYSLDKLARLRLLRETASDEPAVGPDRNVYETTGDGRAALAAALEREDWTTGRDRPPFLTWMALSWRAPPRVFEAQLRRRRAFLTREIVRERATLRGVRAEVGHPFHEAVWMLTLMIEQLRSELRWLKRVERQAPRRAPARHGANERSE